jgi:putative heme iron utilization protein
LPGLDDELKAVARGLMRRALTASLATLDDSGDPFVSLVTVATDPAGAPLLLLSDLSAHTRHLAAVPRLSLLVAEIGKGDPLAHPRLTLGGTAARLPRDSDAAVRSRFLRRHPKAALYADFGDFAFWHVTPTTAHMNGGFARAADWPAADLLTDVSDADDLLATAEGALDHMNADHADALSLYARAFADESDGEWIATGLDPEGIDLVCAGRAARLAFPARVRDAATLRACLVDLAKDARAKLGA